MEEILSGPGSLLNLDDKQILQKFYEIVLDINNSQKLVDVIDEPNQKLLIRIAEKVFIRKRQLNNETVGSFVKQFMLLCKALPDKNNSFRQTLLFCIKLLIIVSLALMRNPNLQINFVFTFDV